MGLSMPEPGPRARARWGQLGALGPLSPRTPSQIYQSGPHTGTKSQIIEEVGERFQAVTDANNGVPPLGGAYDGHGAHFDLNLAFLGMLSAIAKLDTIPFFRRFRAKSLGLPFVPFMQPVFKASDGTEYEMFSCQDPKHAWKRTIANSRYAIHAVMMGCLYCSFARSLKGLLGIVGTLTPHPSKESSWPLSGPVPYPRPVPGRFLVSARPLGRVWSGSGFLVGPVPG